MNWFFVLVLAFVFVGGPVLWNRAVEKDREDRRAVHLFHGPDSQCIECVDK